MYVYSMCLNSREQMYLESVLIVYTIRIEMAMISWFFLKESYFNKNLPRPLLSWKYKWIKFEFKRPKLFKMVFNKSHVRLLSYHKFCTPVMHCAVDQRVRARRALLTASLRGVGSISILGPRVLKIMQYHIVDKKA